jgi:hypothetical protein
MSFEKKLEKNLEKDLLFYFRQLPINLQTSAVCFICQIESSLEKTNPDIDEYPPLKLVTPPPHFLKQHEKIPLAGGF